ncbi:isopentenyl-diphosphate Delta-isomerase [Williamsia deligens]|uniref:Isopentenyl-diphosphate Delta-isomerase n=1 Tax=Williamsia deligens TaxID=321325 RepID=A0ABW3G5E4_9NOCA|nr:isopentenyl-diphosphate Delta-isomerase [Williamsia deligens]
MNADLVVLTDDAGRPTGTADRTAVHTLDTPLHLAFSCFVVADGAILMTRRALSKRTWPGVWTNSFCGHPRPDEAVEDAVRRYAPRELGLRVTDLQCVLPDFRYRAVDASGVVENEICPVFVARPVGPVDAAPDEVAEHAWADVADVWTSVRATPWAFSPWFADQVAQLSPDDLLRPVAARS